jgi:hypothetical protein
MLPSRRIELYLAQISLQVAKLAGVQNVSLEDFMFDPVDIHGDDGDEPTAEEEAEFFGFKPRNLKNGSVE